VNGEGLEEGAQVVTGLAAPNSAPASGAASGSPLMPTFPRRNAGGAARSGR
jgi:hypothetical protein